MAFTINQVNVAANASLGVLIDQVNKAINAISNFVLTVNVAANGVLNTGSDYPDRIYLGNSSVNSTIDSTSGNFITINGSNLIIGNIIANTTVFQVGANVKVNTSVLSLGNSSVNVQTNTSMITISGSNVATVANRSSVSKANTFIGSRGRINFIEGTNISLDVNDDANGQINVTITSDAVVGNSQPGGSNTQIQFNDSNGLAGDAGLIWDKNSKTLTSSNTISASILIANCSTVNPKVVNLTSNGVLDSFILLNYRTVEYTISVTDNSTLSFQASKVLVTHDGSTPLMTEYAQLYTNSAVALFTLSSNATHAIISASPTSSSNVTYKMTRTLIEI